jgi:hypothetical protein
MLQKTQSFSLVSYIFFPLSKVSVVVFVICFWGHCTYIAQCLQVLQHRQAALAPWFYVVSICNALTLAYMPQSSHLPFLSSLAFGTVEHQRDLLRTGKNLLCHIYALFAIPFLILRYILVSHSRTRYPMPAPV